MKFPEIEKLIIKYVTNSISAVELDELSVWLEETDNKQVFCEYIRINYAIDFNMSQYDTGKTEMLLLKKIKKDSNMIYNIKIISLLKYAAIFIGIIGIIYFLQKGNVPNQELKISNEIITIKLDNGNVEELTNSGEIKILDKKGKIVGIQSGSKLNYQNKNSSQISSLQNKKLEELAYNELTVPYGKKFQIILSDGTEVFLNAGTSFKYPVKFINDVERQVYLISGEAYFDVSKDTKRPFIVNTNEMCIRVLGTEFNVSSYPEDPTISTVLVEGLVNLIGKDSVFNDDEALLLKPSYMANWNKSKKEISIIKVDTNLYTSWKNGKLIFKNIQFKNIIKKLERQYNVSIINNNQELDQQYFYATFEKENIEQVLNSFNKSYEIKYTIENNKIIIN
jgi:hypothetical protein